MNKIWAIILAASVMIMSCKASPVCEGLSSAVKVTVKHVGDAPVYEFKITNSHDENIAKFEIGLAPDVGKSSTQSNLISTKITSPLWWKGIQTYRKEDGHIIYHWESYATDRDIVPEGTLSGFRLVMPAPVDMSQFRFWVSVVKDYGYQPSPGPEGCPVTVEKW